MADSSTDATPSMTSPSPGMIFPGLDDHVVAQGQTGCRATGSSRGLAWLGLPVEQPPRHGPPAWSLRSVLGLRPWPRPSATALGEVGEQHGQPQPDDDRPVEDG